MIFNKKYETTRLVIASIIIVLIRIFQWFVSVNGVISIGYGVVTCLCGLPILFQAYRDLKYKVIGIDVLVSIAVIGALVIGEISEAAMVTYLFQLGTYLEQRTIKHTRKSIQTLLEKAPVKALKIVMGQIEEVSVDDVEIGDYLLVKTGQYVPVDGVIIDGSGCLNESSITGESMRVEKGKDDFIYASSVLESGMLKMKATRVKDDTTFSKIIALVEEAQDSKSAIEKFINRFAKGYTPTVIVFAVLMAFITQDISKAITVLVLACPGALVIGVPIANVAGIGKGAKEGILLKGGESITTFAKIQHIFFDKTGTLTTGELTVNRFYEYADRSLLNILKAMEDTSIHPTALAICRYLKELGVEGKNVKVNVEERKGQGIVGYVGKQRICMGNKRFLQMLNVEISEPQDLEIETNKKKGSTCVYVGVDDKLAFVFELSDKIKTECAHVISKFKKNHLNSLTMLTGDTNDVASEVANQIGINDVHAQLLPEDKLKWVEKAKEKGEYVAFVGDGINDSPSLASAHVGIAMGNGTDVAVETSDVVLVHSDLMTLYKAWEIAKKTHRVMNQNIMIALMTVVILLIGLFMGYIHMALGMFIHEMSILLVLLNAMRLLRMKEER